MVVVSQYCIKSVITYPSHKLGVNMSFLAVFTVQEIATGSNSILMLVQEQPIACSTEQKVTLAAILA